MRMNILTADTLDSTVELFKAFADPVRLRLLNLLADGDVCVCHLHEALELPQSTVSRHLAYLRKRGLVIGRKEGLWVYYRLAKPVGELHRMLIGGLGACGQAVTTLAEDRKRLTGRSCCDD
jgi:ArsR family transcriptional regulator